MIPNNKHYKFYTNPGIKRSYIKHFSALTFNHNALSVNLKKLQGSKGFLIIRNIWKAVGTPSANSTKFLRDSFPVNHFYDSYKRTMGYFNADIIKPISTNSSTEDINLFNYINSMNIRKHPFVLEFNSNHKVYSLEEFKNLLKNGEHKAIKIKIIGHLTHTEKPQLLEKSKKILPFSFTDSDGKKRECFMVYYKKPIDVPPNVDFKINPVRSSFLEKRTKILDIITQERDKILLKPATTISHTEPET